MRTGTLGSLEVSVIGLGCNNFGRTLDQRGSTDVVNAALDAGMTVFDTSDNYGEGRSESYLGAALGRRRGEAVIATKFGRPVAGVANSGGAAPSYIRKAVERSLAQIGTDYIDLYQLHLPDPDVPIGDTLAELNALVEEGKIRELGCSNFDADQLEDASRVATDRGLRPFVSNQIEYSLLHRVPELDGSIEACSRHEVAVLPYFPLASGMLTGKARRGEPVEGRLQTDRYKDLLTDSNFGTVENLRPFASERRLSLAQVALGWLLAQRSVPFVTAGATKPEQVMVNATAAEWIPAEPDLAALDAITWNG